MGYTDKHGRPEVIAQPFIKKGLASARVVDRAEDQPTGNNDGAETGGRRAGRARAGAAPVGRGRAHLERQRRD